MPHDNGAPHRTMNNTVWGETRVTAGNQLSDRLRQLIPSRHKDIPIDRIGEFSVLDSVHSVWMEKSTNGLPQDLEPLELPTFALPNVMLIDLERHPRNARIRLAGTLPCRLYGGELKGRTVHDFFAAKDAEHVLGSLFAAADKGVPCLTQRSYVALANKHWAYTRLVLPLSEDGETVNRVFKVLEPNTFSEI